MPTFAALLIGILALKAYREGSDIPQSVALAFFPVGMAILALAALMYSPYLLDINAGVNGIGVVITHTRAVHMFIVWGLFLTAITPFLLATFWQTTVQRDWAAQTLTAGALAGAPWLLWTLAYLPSDGSIEEVISRFIASCPSPRWWQSASITRSISQGRKTKAAGCSQRFSQCSAWDSSSARSSCSSETSSTIAATPSSSSTIRRGYCSPLHPPSPCTTG